jgi:hypothetical protein
MIFRTNPNDDHDACELAKGEHDRYCDKRANDHGRVPDGEGNDGSCSPAVSVFPFALITRIPCAYIVEYT